MGLDALDLCFRLEKQFGIKISREEGFAVLYDTPGTIHRYLMSKLRGECEKTPDVEPLVLKIYKSVNRITGWWRLTSSLDLNKRFAPVKRKEYWRLLETELGVSLPKLDYSTNDPYPVVPRQCGSVVSLAKWIVDNHPDYVEWISVDCTRSGKTADREWTEEEVWEKLRECIVDALGVKQKEVVPDARMIEDLGME